MALGLVPPQPGQHSIHVDNDAYNNFDSALKAMQDAQIAYFKSKPNLMNLKKAVAGVVGTEQFTKILSDFNDLLATEEGVALHEALGTVASAVEKDDFTWTDKPAGFDESFIVTEYYKTKEGVSALFQGNAMDVFNYMYNLTE